VNSFIAERPADSRVLYAGGFKYRSVTAALGLLTLLAMGAAGIWIFSLSAFPILAAGTAGVFTAVLVLYVIWMLLGRKQGFSIETAGIIDGKSFVPWSKIQRFAAEGQPKGMNRTLFYETGGSEPFGRHSLCSSRRIRACDYERLIALLRDAGVAKSHPALELGGYQSC
jgi:hypothetical protein